MIVSRNEKMASDGSACVVQIVKEVSVLGERFIIMGRFHLDSILYQNSLHPIQVK